MTDIDRPDDTGSWPVGASVASDPAAPQPSGPSSGRRPLSEGRVGDTGAAEEATSWGRRASRLASARRRPGQAPRGGTALRAWLAGPAATDVEAAPDAPSTVPGGSSNGMGGRSEPEEASPARESRPEARSHEATSAPSPSRGDRRPGVEAAGAASEAVGTGPSSSPGRDRSAPPAATDSVAPSDNVDRARGGSPPDRSSGGSEARQQDKGVDRTVGVDEAARPSTPPPATAVGARPDTRRPAKAADLAGLEELRLDRDQRDGQMPDWMAKRIVESEAPGAAYELGKQRRWRRRKVTVLRSRTNRRLVRRIDTWTVFKVSLGFYFLMVVITLVAGVATWSVAQHLGFINDIQKSVRSLADDRTFIFHGKVAFKYAAAGGAVLGVLGTLFNTVAAMLYNLLSDVFGGLQVIVVTEPD